MEILTFEENELLKDILQKRKDKLSTEIVRLTNKTLPKKREKFRKDILMINQIKEKIVK